MRMKVLLMSAQYNYAVLQLSRLGRVESNAISKRVDNLSWKTCAQLKIIHTEQISPSPPVPQSPSPRYIWPIYKPVMILKKTKNKKEHRSNEYFCMALGIREWV